MAKSRGKKKPDAAREPKRVLGQDPFEGLDIEWLNREEGELSIKVLGHDPFENMDSAGWIGEEREELFPGLAQTEIEIALGEAEAKVTEEADEFALEQVVVEELSPEPSVTEIELPVQPQLPEPPRADRPAVVTPAKRLMPAATFHFPADFKWGIATAAHQVEGDNIHNDWWAWEQEEGHIKKGHTSGLACDWWNNAEADFDRAAEMGMNSLRLSVEWSRIEPRPGVFDDAALDRYVQMLQGLRERNIEPMVTLHHFSNPRWLAEQGGWEAPETIALFARFVRRVVEPLGKYCNLWCTINEPNVYGTLGYLEGVFPPGQSDLNTAMRVIRNLLAGHAAAYREIHTVQPHARVGLAHNMRIFDPANPRSLLDRRVARTMDSVYNQAILTALTKGRWKRPLGFGLAWKLRRTLDWIGLNYYTRDMVAFDRTQSQTLFGRRQHADGADLLDGGYGEFYPEGMLRCLQQLARLGLPIYVTENGIPDDDDDQRPRYLLTHLHQMWRAIQACYPVMGYYHWTLVDNFEWAEGWTLRFGLIALDLETQARTPRPSADLYVKTVQANAITPAIIDTYAPELRTDLLPG
ncbi:MAG: glycoside hydrolase family 1 protein [Chloroflexota bacterium]|nr:glycoside hydrolase family 1 protein [Chloroflexota bacterium]